MKHLKHLISGLLMASLLLGCLAILPHPKAEAATVASGTCGDSLTWVLDDAGTLTISGTGAMTNYTSSSSAPWYSSRSSIEIVIIKAGVTSIGDYAFHNCSNLTNIIIPDSVIAIGCGAFYNCSSLTSVTIPDGVGSVRDHLFFGCASLTSITIPGDITTIGSGAFYNCTSLTSITIPNSVISIGSSVFYGCSGLTSVTISNSVTSIGNLAFTGCTGLKSITIPDNVTTIGDSAFSGCSGLTSITIPDSVTTIGITAFSSCTGLTSITIPDSVTSIDELAFYGCTGLTGIWVSEDNLNYSSDSYGVLFDKAKTSLIQAPACITGTYVIPECLTTIGDSAFSGCSGLTSITIPNGVTSIGLRSFFNCSSLTSVTIGDSVSSIGWQAFFGCTGLREIYFDGSAPAVDDAAFNNVTATAYYYPDETWTEDVMQDYSGTITWVVREKPGQDVTISFEGLDISGDSVTIQIISEGASEATYEFSSADAAADADSWTVEGIAEGSYTVKVSKKNYVAREYSLTVGDEAAVLDVELWLIGDVTGDGLVNFSDYSKVLSQSKNPTSEALTDYAFLCGDVTGDGIINFSDYSKILSQAKGNHTLW